MGTKVRHDPTTNPSGQSRARRHRIGFPGNVRIADNSGPSPADWFGRLTMTIIHAEIES